MVHIVIIGPGLMPIPPTGWGACESLIWDYKLTLDKYYGDKILTTIVNKARNDEIMRETVSLKPDIIHIQYDNHAHLAPIINELLIGEKPNLKIFLTSHYAYLTTIHARKGDGYLGIFNTFVNIVKDRNQFNNKNIKILALSPLIANTYINSGAPEDTVIVAHNGANQDLFRYTKTPLHSNLNLESNSNRALYLGKIDIRKNQTAYFGINSLWFAGNIDRTVDPNRVRNQLGSRYLGEWQKDVLYNSLTDYATLVLLSDGEAHPLVVCEALIAGLGVVLSNKASANLDLSLPFIDVIPDDKLGDINYVSAIIDKNMKVSLSLRETDTIRNYGLQKFGWDNVVKRYLEIIL